MQLQKEAEAAAARDKEAAQEKELLESMMGGENGSGKHNKYVHAWVMVMAGNREVCRTSSDSISHHNTMHILQSLHYLIFATNSPKYDVYMKISSWHCPSDLIHEFLLQGSC